MKNANSAITLKISSRPLLIVIINSTGWVGNQFKRTPQKHCRVPSSLEINLFEVLIVIYSMLNRGDIYFVIL